MIELPGLNPSLRSYGATLTWTPFVFVGIALCGRSTRRPVALVGSGLVKRLLGNGSRQGSTNGWQSAAGVEAPAAAGAPSTPSDMAATTVANARPLRTIRSLFASPLMGHHPWLVARSGG